MRIAALVFSLVLFVQNLSAQKTQIRGNGNSYRGKELTVYTYTDLITFRERSLGKATLDTAGNFNLDVTLDHIRPLFLKIGNVKGNFFAEPGGLYTLYVPPVSDSTSASSSRPEYNVNLEFYLKDSLDINALIIDYNRQFDKFWSRYYQYFIAKRSRAKMDSFKLAIKEHYVKVRKPYFHTHVEYAIAAIEENTFGRGSNNIARDYLVSRPIYYDNLEYMNFFNEFFKGRLQEFTLTDAGARIPSIVNGKPEYAAMMETMALDKQLKNDTLRELVLLKGLWEFYYSGRYSTEGIITILEEIGAKGKVQEHRKIAENMLAVFPRIVAGKKAPEIVLKDLQGKEVKLSGFKGKHVYFNFWSSANNTCLQEMKLMQDYRKKYGNKIVFVSICTDKTKEEMKAFLAKNPKYDWTQLYCDDESLLQTYEIRMVPTYFLVDDKGYFIQKAPSASPPAIEETLFRIAKPKDKKQGVGEKQNQR